MNCSRCQKPASVDLSTTGKLCMSCFCNIIEKRIRKGLRRQNIKKGEVLVIKDTETPEGAMSLYILQKVLKNFPCTISSTGDHDRLIIPTNAEQEAATVLECLFHHKPLPKAALKPLQHILAEEVNLYVDYKKLSYSEALPKHPLNSVVQDIEKRYPGSLFSLLKSGATLANLPELTSKST